jgi:hypothetical protein
VVSGCDARTDKTSYLGYPHLVHDEAVPQPGRPESLASLLGGGRGALDATLPVVAFAAAWLLTGRSVVWGGAAAVVVAGIVAWWRLRTGARPRAFSSGRWRCAPRPWWRSTPDRAATSS